MQSSLPLHLGAAEDLKQFPRTIPGKIVLAIAASAFVALCAHVSVPLYFTPVPLTLQTFAVILVGLALGPIVGASAMVPLPRRGRHRPARLQSERPWRSRPAPGPHRRLPLLLPTRRSLRRSRRADLPWHPSRPFPICRSPARRSRRQRLHFRDGRRLDRPLPPRRYRSHMVLSRRAIPARRNRQSLRRRRHLFRLQPAPSVLILMAYHRASTSEAPHELTPTFFLFRFSAKE